MSANTWYVISLVGYFAALIGLIVTVILYFRLDILDVIGDLSGRTVARELKSMRENRSTKTVKTGSRARKISKTSGTSKSGKVSQTGSSHGSKQSSGKTAGAAKPAAFSGKRAKNGTAEMGSGFQTGRKTGSGTGTQTDKLVLHSKTDKLSRDTEELYEDFDPRVEYSRTDILEETAEQKKSGGTAVLKPGTEVLQENDQQNGSVEKRKGTDILPERGTAVLRSGTELLAEASSGGGTTLLVEDEQIEPVKFSITRSCLVVHTEEKIL